MNRFFFGKALAVSLLLICSGCAPPVILGAGVAGVGVAKDSYDRIVEHSYAYPYWAVYKASHVSFDELAIDRIRIESTGDGDILYGQTKDYAVEIELYRVTSSLTRVTCRAGNTIFTQDTATAAAIAQHINSVLERVFTSSDDES